MIQRAFFPVEPKSLKAASTTAQAVSSTKAIKIPLRMRISRI